MKLCIPILVIVLSIETAFCQDIEIAINLKIDSLRNEKVDTILLSKFYFSGGIRYINDSNNCNILSTYYLIWIKNDSIYCLKLDDCNKYKTLALKSLLSLDFFIENSAELKKEKIEPPSYFEYSKKTKRNVKLSQIISHSFFYTLNLHIQNEKIELFVDTQGLESEFIDKKKNLSYDKNHKTKLYQLLKTFEIETNLLDNFFVKTKRKM